MTLLVTINESPSDTDAGIIHAVHDLLSEEFDVSAVEPFTALQAVPQETQTNEQNV